MMRRITVGPLLVILVLMITTVASDTAAFDQRFYKGGFGVKGGFLYVSTVHLHDKYTGNDVGDYQSKAGLTAGIFFDVPLYRKTTLGFDLDLLDIQIQDDREKLFNIGLNAKHAYTFKHSRMGLRPGLGVGYGYLAEIGFVQQANLLVVRAFTEVLFLSDPKAIWLVEGAVMMAPYGRSKEYQFTTNPFLVLRGGVRF